MSFGGFASTLVSYALGADKKYFIVFGSVFIVSLCCCILWKRYRKYFTCDLTITVGNDFIKFEYPAMPDYGNSKKLYNTTYYINKKDLSLVSVDEEGYLNFYYTSCNLEQFKLTKDLEVNYSKSYTELFTNSFVSIALTECNDERTSSTLLDYIRYVKHIKIER